MTTATSDILAAATQQTTGMSEQEAVLGQTLGTVEQIRVTVKQTAERTQSVADLSEQSVGVARKGLKSA